MTGVLSGMTDSQFKAFVREVINGLEKALEINPDNQEILAMLKRFRETLQS
ncbi:MAG: hypothetical protein FWB74_04610 [Defluviitaleaceae bacterium]|nr:hypothetical protein [Defluviitaleaceae bacterium]